MASIRAQWWAREISLCQHFQWFSSFFFASFCFFCVIGPVNAAGTCGQWKDTYRDIGAFLKTEPGSLALTVASGLALFEKNSCVRLRNASELTFVVNHTSDISDHAYLAVHAVFARPSPQPGVVYLFRNQKANANHWQRDTTRLEYRSVHDGDHQKFNDTLSGSRQDFDRVYKDQTNRTWNDAVNSPATGGQYETWDSRNNFKLAKQFFDAGQKGLSISTQNYFISYSTESQTGCLISISISRLIQAEPNASCCGSTDQRTLRHRSTETTRYH